MSRINSNIPSLIAQSTMTRTSKELQLRLERLSTGLRINRGADDPAGLIVSERLRSDINGVNQGIKNSDRASSVIATTEGSLAEVNGLLNSIKALIVESANTGANSKAEREANQLQIDSAIDSITRISNTASFGGLKLLNGSLDYQLSGVRSSAITNAHINNAQFIDRDNLQVQIDVVASAQTGALFYNGGTGRLPSGMTLQVTGTRGVETITLPSGQTLASLVAAVNNVTQLTGVKAKTFADGVNSSIVFESMDYGSDAFVSVQRLGGPSNNDPFQLYKFDNNGPKVATASWSWSSLTTSGSLIKGQRDTGQDVSALVNGNLASGDGLKISVNSSSLGMDVVLNEDYATRPSATIADFNITGGGTIFQLGQDVNALQQSTLGIQSMAASNLGATLSDGLIYTLASLKSGGDNSIAESVKKGDFSVSSNVLDASVDQVSILRGRLGAFEKNVLQTNVRSLQASFENLSASVSQIRDADFAFETSQLTRAQILSSAGTSVLSLANQQSQQVLQLLG